MKQVQARNRGRPKAFHDKSEGAIIQSLDRAIDVLKSVADADGLSLTEIAEAGGQSPATVYRILTTLAAELLAAAAKHDLPQLDEMLYLDVFVQPETPAPRRASRRCDRVRASCR